MFPTQSVNYYYDLDRAEGTMMIYTGRTGQASDEELGFTYDNHVGTDYNNVGQDVYAAGAGIVIGSGWNDAVGWYVTMQHDVIVTRYAHLNERVVYVDDQVSAGQKIGVAGATGSECDGAHLHFDLYTNYANNTRTCPYAAQYFQP